MRRCKGGDGSEMVWDWMGVPWDFWMRQVPTPTRVARGRGGADATLGYAGFEAGLVPRPSHGRSTKKLNLERKTHRICSMYMYVLFLTCTPYARLKVQEM